MKIEVPEQIEAAERLGVVHLVGIGGAGLSAIAREVCVNSISSLKVVGVGRREASHTCSEASRR